MSALLPQSLVCGVFWGTEMGWSLHGGGHGCRGFIAAERCARGRPRPVLMFCRRPLRRCPGSCVCEARSANQVCSGGVQVVLSYTPPTNGQLQPSRACNGNSVHEHGRRVYHPRNKLTRRCANWSGDEIAIGSHRRIHHGQTSTLPSLFVAHNHSPSPQDGAPGWWSPITLLPVPNVGGGGWKSTAGARGWVPQAVPLNVLDRVDLLG